MAAYLCPDGSREAAYFRKIIANNIAYARANIPAWAAERGELAGWFGGDYGNGDVIAPWQLCFLRSSIAMWERFGFEGANEIGAYIDQFIVGCVLNLGPTYASAYNLMVRPGGTLVKTWGELKTLMDGPAAWGMTPDQQYPGNVLMALQLSDHPRAAEAIAAMMAEYGATKLSPAALDSAPNYDFRAVA